MVNYVKKTKEMIKEYNELAATVKRLEKQLGQFNALGQMIVQNMTADDLNMVMTDKAYSDTTKLQKDTPVVTGNKLL